MTTTIIGIAHQNHGSAFWYGNLESNGIQPYMYKSILGIDAS